jgi:hypothetical protein
MPFARNEAREINEAQGLPHRFSSVMNVGVMDFKGNASRNISVY